MYGQKKKFSTFSYKLVQISPIMILVNSGAFLSISSWFCELTELIFVMILYISSTGYPPKRKGLWLCASSEWLFDIRHTNLPRFQGARPDHVRVESSSCCFLRAVVSLTHDTWHVLLQSGNVFEVGGTTKSIVIPPISNTFFNSAIFELPQASFWKRVLVLILSYANQFLFTRKWV